MIKALLLIQSFLFFGSVGYNCHLLWRLNNMPENKQKYYNPAPKIHHQEEIPVEIFSPAIKEAEKEVKSSLFPIVCPADLNTVLKGKLAGKGDLFLKAANKWKIDPILLTAISCHETGQGTSPRVYKQNNPGGLMIGGKTFITYQNIETGIDNMAERIQKNYYAYGLKTAETIQPKYCPIGAANDPKGINKHWLTGVKKFIKIINDNKLPQYAKS